MDSTDQIRRGDSGPMEKRVMRTWHGIDAPSAYDLAVEINRLEAECLNMGKMFRIHEMQATAHQFGILFEVFE
jgi:hypothetical protein